MRILDGNIGKRDSKIVKLANFQSQVRVVEAEVLFSSNDDTLVFTISAISTYYN